MTSQTIVLQPGDVLTVSVPASTTTPPPVTTPPPTTTPPPSGGSANFEVDPTLWTFGALGSAGGNYRLEVAPNQSTVSVAFTTSAAGKGASINLQWSSGATSSHKMSVMGVQTMSQTPSLTFATSTPSGNRIVLQPYTRYVMTITTPDSGLGGLYHLNFQNAPY